METAIQTLVKVFLKSTKGKESLGKQEFQNLVKSQLSNILSDTDSNEAVNEMGQGLDANNDGKVGFEEYMKLVGYLAVSLSEQRNLVKEEPAQNAASGQVAQNAPDKEEKTPEAKEEAKPEASAEAKADASAEVKAEAIVAPAVELKVDANASPKVEVKAEGATEPKARSEEEMPAAAVEVSGVEVVTTVKEEVVVTEEVKVENTEEEAEEVAEKVAAGADEVEKKTEEATS